MQSEQLLNYCAALAIGAVLGIIVCALSLLRPYRSAINEAHWAKEVITECIDQYPDFYDTIAEGDAYSEWVEYANK